MAALRQLLRLNCKRISGGLVGYAPPPRHPPAAALGNRTFFTSKPRVYDETTATPRYWTRDDPYWTHFFTDLLYKRLFLLTLDFFWIVLPGYYMMGKLADQWNAAAAGSHSPPAPAPLPSHNNTDRHPV